MNTENVNLVGRPSKKSKSAYVLVGAVVIVIAMLLGQMYLSLQEEKKNAQVYKQALSDIVERNYVDEKQELNTVVAEINLMKLEKDAYLTNYDTTMIGLQERKIQVCETIPIEERTSTMISICG